MSWQLCCQDMSKTVTLLHYQNQALMENECYVKKTNYELINAWWNEFYMDMFAWEPLEGSGTK